MTRKSKRELERVLDQLEESRPQVVLSLEFPKEDREELDHLTAEAREALPAETVEELDALGEHITEEGMHCGEDQRPPYKRDLTGEAKQYLDLLFGEAGIEGVAT